MVLVRKVTWQTFVALVVFSNDRCWHRMALCSARGHARSIASPGRGALPFRACSTARALIAAAAGGSAAAWALLTMRCAQLRSSAHRTTLSPGSLCWGARVQASLASAVVRSGRSSLDTELFLKKAGLKIVSWHGICVG